ncbi:MAG: PIN domain-containing protein [Balneola sp.]
MRVLLDTNILIHRETGYAVNEDIGRLFFWLDKIKAEKIIHPVSVNEIEGHNDEKIKKSFSIKLQHYTTIKTDISLAEEIVKTICPSDTSQNDKNDTILLNEVFRKRVDLLVTEDKGIHRKAKILGIENSVVRIEKFVEQSTIDHPRLIDYKVLTVKKEYLGNIDLSDPFFDSFKEDYNGFESWFLRKSDEITYVCYTDSRISAFLYLKIEDKQEDYSDIEPFLKPKKRVKIGTFKVTLNGLRLGERFLKIVFDHALLNNVDEIYVTVFPKRQEQLRLINMLEDWGFKEFGIKTSENGKEKVFTRSFLEINTYQSPQTSFPFISNQHRPFVVPIYPEYHTRLLPDSILNTESTMDFKENRPVSNSIRKSYISHSIERNLKPGDPIFFYRTGGYHKSVITTIGIVQKVHNDLSSFEELRAITRKRTVLSDKKLREFWDRFDWSNPFVVDFLYAYSLPKRPNLKLLIDNNIIKDVDSAPRGFSRISWDQATKILELANGKKSLIIN